MECGKATFVIGGVRGDEGKGRIVDIKAKDNEIVVRAQGGPNAGHQVERNGIMVTTKQIPTGILHPGKLNLSTNGVWMDPTRLIEEIGHLSSYGYEVTPDNYRISYAAHLIMEHHVALDNLREESSSRQGSTRRGIAYVAAAKGARASGRVEDLMTLEGRDYLVELAYAGLQEALQLGAPVREELKSKTPKPYIRQWVVEARDLLAPHAANTTEILNDALEEGQNVLVEGAQAYGLDPDHGTWPYVTSSPTTVAYMLHSMGVPVEYAGDRIGVIKIFPSNVGDGLLPTLIQDDEIAEIIRLQKGEPGAEYGSVTERPRDVGWLDLVPVRTAARVNGLTELAVNKLDIIPRIAHLGEIPVTTAYEYRGRLEKYAPESDRMLRDCIPKNEWLPIDNQDVTGETQWYKLSRNMQDYIRFIERQTKVPVTFIGTGTTQQDLIRR